MALSEQTIKNIQEEYGFEKEEIGENPENKRYFIILISDLWNHSYFGNFEDILNDIQLKINTCYGYNKLFSISVYDTEKEKFANIKLKEIELTYYYPEENKISYDFNDKSVRNQMQEKILSIIQDNKNEGCGSTYIHNITSYEAVHIRELMENLMKSGKIKKIGERSKTRYFPT